MNVDQNIFREYDIRGIVGQNITAEVATLIGRSVASRMKKEGKKLAIVGFDGRLSSPELSNSLIDGLISSGIDVINIGVGPSPMLYFATYFLEADYGIMVTGSHNPPEYNGFKIMSRAKPFYGEDLQQLLATIKNSDFTTGQGSLSQKDIKQAYVDRLMADCTINKKLKIAWDPGNGSGGEITEMLLPKIDAEHSIINSTIDGTFPNHHPDPTVEENLEQIKKLLAENKCDLGIAFDGDADRIGVIDNEGTVIWGDQLLIIYAREILKHFAGATIIADIKASEIFNDEILKAGGKPLIWKTGHSLIKAKMLETDAKLAGEMSGHIFFNDIYYGFDDALYAAIRLINIVSNSDLSLSDIRKSLPITFSTPEIRIECEEEKKFMIVKELQATLRNEGVEFLDIDGVRVKTNDGWWLIRASNTQPVLVGRCESSTEEGLENLKAEVSNYISHYGLQLNI
jgi:phosphomannomutase